MKFNLSEVGDRQWWASYATRCGDLNFQPSSPKFYKEQEQALAIKAIEQAVSLPMVHAFL